MTTPCCRVLSPSPLPSVSLSVAAHASHPLAGKKCHNQNLQNTLTVPGSRLPTSLKPRNPVFSFTFSFSFLVLPYLSYWIFSSRYNQLSPILKGKKSFCLDFLFSAQLLPCLLFFVSEDLTLSRATLRFLCLSPAVAAPTPHHTALAGSTEHSPVSH